MYKIYRLLYQIHMSYADCLEVLTWQTETLKYFYVTFAWKIGDREDERPCE